MNIQIYHSKYAFMHKPKAKLVIFIKNTAFINTIDCIYLILLIHINYNKS